MKIVLTEDVDKLGEEGEVVEVKDGYARNYLIPQGKARYATDGYLRHVKEIKKQAARKAELNEEQAQELADTLKATSVTIPVQTGEGDKIHGSITNADIADALAERDIHIDRRKISLDDDVRSLGEYTATVNLLGDLNPTLKVWVVKGD